MGIETVLRDAILNSPFAETVTYAPADGSGEVEATVVFREVGAQLSDGWPGVDSMFSPGPARRARLLIGKDQVAQPAQYDTVTRSGTDWTVTAWESEAGCWIVYLDCDRRGAF